MRLPTSPAALAALLLACSDLASAHGQYGDLPVPKFMGGGRRLRAEMMASVRAEMAANNNKDNNSNKNNVATIPTNPMTREEMETGDENIRQRSALRRRQIGGKDGQCGPGFGSCAKGYCCSPEGWCGLTSDYCSAPDCLINYGSGCDANQKPSGVDTSGVARPHVGSVLYGGLGIYDCVKTGDIAITFDDGPYNYTGDLLDKFCAKATFFITGNNLGKGMINDYSKPWAGYIRRMIAEGHQVASHTWSHQNASQLTAQQYRDQIIWNEIAFNDILGFFPTYMRPPYSICEAACQKTLSELGYHVTYFDLDTEGYLHDDPSLIQACKDIWDEAMEKASPSTSQFLMIEHDIHYQSVYNLTDYVLTDLFSRGYRSVTVGECLGDPKENWYRQGPASNGGSSSSSSSSSASRPTGIPSTTIRRPPSQTIDSHAGSGSGSGTAARGKAGSTAVVSDTPLNAHAGSSSSPVPSVVQANPAPTAPAASTLQKTKNGDCGKGITCLGSRFGNCCSSNGWCGATSDYCGSTCQPQFGTCADSQR